jgi:hypothetical protein
MFVIIRLEYDRVRRKRRTVAISCIGADMLAKCFLIVAVFIGTGGVMNRSAMAQSSPTTAESTAQDRLLATLQVFPADDEWNRDISREAVDPKSAAYIEEIGPNKPLHPDWGTKYGIPFQFVDARTPRVQPRFQNSDESDRGLYPIPTNPLIEGVLASGLQVSGDRHILCIDSTEKKLYELWNCQKILDQWSCGSGAIYDLSKKSTGQRPPGWTSADAAGLPIFPGLIRYDEICLKKELTHAVRFTVVKTRRSYISPASHYASRSSDPALPPMGMRMRLRAGFDITPFPPAVQVILRGLKKYGMILADNGSDWFISGAPDPRWDDDAMNTLKKVKGTDLEVLKMGPVTNG